MIKFSRLLLILVTIFSFNKFLIADDKPAEVKNEAGIEEKLGSYIPKDLTFFDENGQKVVLKDLMKDKPTIFSLIYFRCPGICSPLTTGLAEAVDKLDMTPGKDFNIVSISFNPDEDFIMAAEKKKNYLLTMKRSMNDESWRFLTGDSMNIARISDALGFRYQKQGVDYMHGASIMVVASDGKITRYLFGTQFNPFDLKMALIESSEGRIGPTIAKVMEFCFSFDPASRKYVLNITRVAGGAILLLLIAFLIFIVFKKKNNSSIQIESQINTIEVKANG